MPTIETSIWIKAPINRVYAIAKDSESYPEYMKDVLSVTLVERSGNRVVSDYVGIVPRFRQKVRWRQEEIWDDAGHRSAFRQLHGDYDHFQGSWTFVEENGGTRFRQFLDYEYNVPTLGALLRKVVLVLVRENLENVNRALKERAERGVAP